VSRKAEALWSGPFGDAYTERNLRISSKRMEFWQHIATIYRPKRVLEVGCNHGANLRHLAQFLDPQEIWGADINKGALEQARDLSPEISFVMASGFDLPFRDGYFDLVFTVGVLIHQPPHDLPPFMTELARCSSRYVLAVEYVDTTFVEIPYRGFDEALYRGPYGEAYRKMGMMLMETGKLGKDSGFDDCTYWVLKK